MIAGRSEGHSRDARLENTLDDAGRVKATVVTLGSRTRSMMPAE
jgi:hypothetical protein